MRCPACLHSLEESVAECPVCGLTLAALDKKFGIIPRNLRSFGDTIFLFSDPEAARLQRAIQLFERKFTNCYFFFITTELLAEQDPREYAFWLFNRSRFGPLEATLSENFTILFLLDMTSRSAVLATGYGLEAVLPEATLQKLIDEALPAFARREFYHGSRRLLAHLRSLLVGHFRKRHSSPAPQPPPDLPRPADAAEAPLLVSP